MAAPFIGRRVLWRRRFEKYGYELRREEVDDGCGHTIEWTMAYTLPRGHYIGEPREARLLCVRLGIRPELRTRRSTVCSVGKSVKNGRWYGWSHRALAAFRTRAAAARFARSVS